MNRRSQTSAEEHRRAGEAAQVAQAAEHAGTIAALRARADNQLSRSQRAVESLTANIGRPSSIALLLSILALWMVWNGYEQATHGHVLDPPPFFWLQGAVALYAALISTFVLATQNREKRHAEQRAYLELQINLLAEQKTAKIIELLEELRRDMPTVRDRIDHQANVMQMPVDTAAVMNVLEGTMDAPDETDVLGLRESRESIEVP